MARAIPLNGKENHLDYFDNKRAERRHYKAFYNASEDDSHDEN
jgi:hypothetical protein